MLILSTLPKEAPVNPCRVCGNSADKPLSRIMNLSATMNESQKIGVESIKRRKTSGGATAAIEWKISSD